LSKKPLFVCNRSLNFLRGGGVRLKKCFLPTAFGLCAHYISLIRLFAGMCCSDLRLRLINSG